MAEADADLVTRIRQGDAGAFEVLMRRHFRMAFIVAYAQLGNRSDAEDVCQDAFFRCWERIAECRDPAHVSAWLSTIVRHTAHNRRDFLRLRHTEGLEAGALVATAERADAAAERHELRSRLEAAMRELSTVQREIVLLHDLEGYRHADIATRLDVSQVMSRRHLSDARRRLRALLGDFPTLEPDRD